MSRARTNYSKKKQHQPEEFDVLEMPTSESDENPPEFVTGFVVDCVKLNIRHDKNTDAPILCEVKENARLLVDPATIHDEWIRVYTEAGIDGFCMRQYVAID